MALWIWPGAVLGGQNRTVTAAPGNWNLISTTTPSARGKLPLPVSDTECQSPVLFSGNESGSGSSESPAGMTARGRRATLWQAASESARASPPTGRRAGSPLQCPAGPDSDEGRASAAGTVGNAPWTPDPDRPGRGNSPAKGAEGALT